MTLSELLFLNKYLIKYPILIYAMPNVLYLLFIMMLGYSLECELQFNISGMIYVAMSDACILILGVEVDFLVG